MCLGNKNTSCFDSRRKEFDAKLAISAFVGIRSRVKFLTYETLVHQFEDETFKANQGFFI